MYEQYKSTILEFYRKQKRMPSYGEIASLLKFKSKNAVAKLVKKLVLEGALAKDKAGKLIPKSLGEIKLLGLVEAGFPSPAEEELADTLSLDDFLIEKKEASYLLRVKGDSMIDAGIQEGDLVIVERSTPPRPGNIVIAEVDGEWTMKYYRTKNGKAYLEAANEKYPDIFPEEELKLVAVVRGVVRKY